MRQFRLQHTHSIVDFVKLTQLKFNNHFSSLSILDTSTTMPLDDKTFLEISAALFTMLGMPDNVQTYTIPPFCEKHSGLLPLFLGELFARLLSPNPTAQVVTLVSVLDNRPVDDFLRRAFRAAKPAIATEPTHTVLKLPAKKVPQEPAAMRVDKTSSSKKSKVHHSCCPSHDLVECVIRSALFRCFRRH